MLDLPILTARYETLENLKTPIVLLVYYGAKLISFLHQKNIMGYNVKVTPLNEPKNAKSRGWIWAYKKVRSYGCSRTSAFYRASLYIFRGDTGVFTNKPYLQRYRIRRS